MGPPGTIESMNADSSTEKRALPARSRGAVVTLLVCGLGLSTLGSAGAAAKPERQPVRVTFGSHVIDLVHPESVSVSGIDARGVEVRLLGAIDRAGLAYEWAPYPWRRLRFLRGAWRGVLPAPALLGIYRLQLRLDDGRRLLSSNRLAAASLSARSDHPPILSLRGRRRPRRGRAAPGQASIGRPQTMAAGRVRPPRPAPAPDLRDRLRTLRRQAVGLTARTVHHDRTRRLPRTLASARSIRPTVRLSEVGHAPVLPRGYLINLPFGDRTYQ